MCAFRHLLNASIIPNGCRGIYTHWPRFCATAQTGYLKHIRLLNLQPNHRYVDSVNKPPGVSTELVLKHLWLIPDFISEDEELSLLQEVDPILRAKKYENDHFDDVS